MMLNRRHNLKLHFMLVLAGLCTTTALAQPCTQLLIASYTPGNVCTGRTLNLSANTISGATYSWAGPLGFSSAIQNPSIPSITINRAGSYIVTATAGSCIYKDTVNVSINQSPTTPTISLMAPPCKGSALSIQLSSSGGVGLTYAVYTPSGALFTPIFNLSSSHNGTYKAVASLPNGCKSDTGYFPLTVIDLPVPTLLADTPICRGDTLHMYVMNNTPFVDNYYWNTPSSSPFYTSPTPLHLPNVTIGGYYSVRTVFDGCMSPMAQTLVVFKPGIFAATTLTADGEIQSGHTEITLTAHITNGGVEPAIQWYKNGLPIAGANDTIYKGTLFTNIFPMDWFYAQVERDSACGGVNYSDTIQVNEVLEVKNAFRSENLSLYPNPNAGTFTLQIPTLEGAATIEIVNSIGQRSFIKSAAGGGNVAINLPATMANGIYSLRLVNGDKVYVTRFTLNR